MSRGRRILPPWEFVNSGNGSWETWDYSVLLNISSKDSDSVSLSDELGNVRDKVQKVGFLLVYQMESNFRMIFTFFIQCEESNGMSGNSTYQFLNSSGRIWVSGL